MMSKISVKGTDKHHLYKLLTEGRNNKKEVGWNFVKFLIGKTGKIVERFDSSVEPESEKILKSLKRLF